MTDTNRPVTYAQQRIKQLEALIPQQELFLRQTPREVATHSAMKSRLDELKLEYRERVGYSWEERK